MGDFDKDLEEYIRTRRKANTINIKDLIQKLIPKRNPKVILPENVELYHKEIEKPKPIKHDTEEVIRAKLQSQDAIDDLKEIARIALGTIKELPDDHLKKFKHGPDFEKLKKILKKHNLIQ